MKHFIKTLLTFALIIFLGLASVFFVSNFVDNDTFGTASVRK